MTCRRGTPLRSSNILTNRTEVSLTPRTGKPAEENAARARSVGGGACGLWAGCAVMALEGSGDVVVRLWRVMVRGGVGDCGGVVEYDE